MCKESYHNILKITKPCFFIFFLFSHWIYLIYLPSFKSIYLAIYPTIYLSICVDYRGVWQEESDADSLYDNSITGIIYIYFFCGNEHCMYDFRCSIGWALLKVLYDSYHLLYTRNFYYEHFTPAF